MDAVTVSDIVAALCGNAFFFGGQMMWRAALPAFFAVAYFAGAAAAERIELRRRQG